MGFTMSCTLINFTITCGPTSETRGSANVRKRVLEKLDNELAKGDERAALLLSKQSLTQPGGLRCFGAARQVPQRLYTLDELKLNGIEAASLLSPVDTTLGSIERNLQIAAISFGGGISGLALDTIGHAISQKYHNRVIQHEAGHFLIAYLLGILPKSYTLSSLEALSKEGSLNVQAGTNFVDFEFVEELVQLAYALTNAGKMSSTVWSLLGASFYEAPLFSCIALAGVATEYLLYGYAEGGLADINKLDGLLKSLGFTHKKADSQLRWAVLNTILLLRRHEEARAKLADAMSKGMSIGSCINVIEEAVDDEDLVQNL
uniref:Stress regulated protein n=1 Tax=Chenopodium quinoa TaxID=63459 RepID=A0A803KPE6_CHEQI